MTANPDRPFRGAPEMFAHPKLTEGSDVLAGTSLERPPTEAAGYCLLLLPFACRKFANVRSPTAVPVAKPSRFAEV